MQLQKMKYIWIFVQEQLNKHMRLFKHNSYFVSQTWEENAKSRQKAHLLKFSTALQVENGVMQGYGTAEAVQKPLSLPFYHRPVLVLVMRLLMDAKCPGERQMSLRPAADIFSIALRGSKTLRTISQIPVGRIV